MVITVLLHKVVRETKKLVREKGSRGWKQNCIISSGMETLNVGKVLENPMVAAAGEKECGIKVYGFSFDPTVLHRWGASYRLFCLLRRSWVLYFCFIVVD